MTETTLNQSESATNELFEALAEQYADAFRAMVRLEDIGWKQLVGQSTLDERFSLEELKDITKKIREWTDTNPLLWRGNEIRCSYMFGGGFEISTEQAEVTISVRAQRDIDDPINQSSVFSPEAMSANERTRYTDGNLFAVFNKVNRRFQIITLDSITDAYYNPDDPSEVYYYLWTRNRRIYDPSTERFDEQSEATWIPTDTYKPAAAHPASIGKHRVDSTRVIVDSRVNRATGQTWGLPDAFAAAPWALAYSNYMRDGSRVLEALASIVWQARPKTRAGADQTAAAIKGMTGPAGVAVTDMELNALPRANAIDLNTGRPLAAQVAAALGISVVILLSDPGQSGAYGTAQTLTDPTIRTMRTRQDLNTQFLVRCLRLLGISKPTVLWAKMAPDSDFREMQLKDSAWQTGLFHEDEARGPIAELAGFNLLHDAPPSGVLIPNNANSLALATIDTDATGMSKATGKGGASKDATQRKAPSDGDNSIRDDQT